MSSASETLTVSVDEAARLLGISRNLAYDLVREGRLPHVRLGRRILVPRFGLEQWLAREANVDPPAPTVLSSARRQRH